jgi:probable addiction module antidote protein
MPKRTTEYRATLLEDLADPKEASAYLNAARDDSPEMLLTALRDVAEAHQMAKVAETAGVSRESLYRMLASGGNPTYRNFVGILKAMGLEFTLSPLEPEDRNESTSSLRSKREVPGRGSEKNSSRRRHRKPIPLD